MKSVYQSPKRIYLIFIALGLLGLVSGLNLPISLFPNTSKPKVWIQVDYDGMTQASFYQNYGKTFEAGLKKIEQADLKIDEIRARYFGRSADYQIEFEWSTPNDLALSETRQIVNNLKSAMPQSMADKIGVNQWNRNSGFLAVSFFGQKKSLDELYRYLNPIFEPELAKVQDAQEALLWLPGHQEIKIKLDPQQVLNNGISIRSVYASIKNSFKSYQGGKVEFSDGQSLTLSTKNAVQNIEDLKAIEIKTPLGKTIYLGTIADINYGPSELKQRIFKTQGAPSLILWATPKSDGNVKRMAEEIKKIIHEKKHLFGDDIDYRFLVDPSEFIQSAISKVVKEVLIAALCAVFVLFLFLGQVKNIVTAAIEIPLSLLMAFIFMQVFDMNLNLISLGGLALAAGMNVDASVVVLENIFRHVSIYRQKHLGQIPSSQLFPIILRAVKEVALPVIFSMITSLVVFIPLVLTQGLANAILADLAKAVVFSHGLSAVIALILVPTVRLQMLKTDSSAPTRQPIVAPVLARVENWYLSTLSWILQKPKRQWSFLGLTLIILISSVSLIVPRLKKEIIGKPDSDWIMVGMNSQVFESIHQLEKEAIRVEGDILKNYEQDIMYSFVQIRGKKRATLMFRLQDKTQMDRIWKSLEKEHTNTPEVNYWVMPWNPAELPLPNPPHLRMLVSAPDYEQAIHFASDLVTESKDLKLYDRSNATPNRPKDDFILYRPYEPFWNKVQAFFHLSDFMHMTRLMAQGENITQMDVNGLNTDINLYFKNNSLNSMGQLKSLYLPYQGKLVSFDALGEFERRPKQPDMLSINGRKLVEIDFNLNRSQEDKKYASFETFKEHLQKKQMQSKKASTYYQLEGPDYQFSESNADLYHALGLSIVLIFLVLYLQFQQLTAVLTIICAIPLGLIGVFLSLFIFDSTLSLNSCLGVILLNGICVNNSLLLVDQFKKQQSESKDFIQVLLQCCQKRLRPILITSLTTIVGMMPIALGLGDGGKILQPLGIAVSGGLGLSTVLTLFTIPVVLSCWQRREKGFS
jgi:multidrug efflux pump subunit AcrB